MEKLRVIGKAVKGYRSEHNGEMPNWLSDLYPKYLQDPNLLLCPADETEGSPARYPAFKDPKMPCSYLYEFNPMKSTWLAFLFGINPPKDLTIKEEKTIELRYFGDLVPVVRCRHHGLQVLNLGYDGKVYLSPGEWAWTPEALNAFLSFFQDAIEDNPDGWEKQLSLEKIHTYLKNRRRLPDLRALLEKQSSPSVDVLKVLGEIYLSDGEIDKTIEIYDRLLRLAPDDTESRFQLARLYALAKNYQAARDQCQRVIQLEPDHPEAHGLLVELDAIIDGRRIQERFSKTPVEDPEIRYLVKLEEMLLASEENLKATVERAHNIAQDSFGESASVTKLGYLYQTLDESFSGTRGQWQTCSTADGLVNNWVWSIAQDDRGILWIGTSDGVCQYDGESFTRFPINEEFDNDRILSILIDRQGDIWFGSYSHGAARYDGEDSVYYTTDNGLGGNNVQKIIQDRNGSIWFAFWGAGISRYDGKTFTNLTTEDGLATNQVYTLVEDSREVLWIGTNGGVSKYDGKTFTNLTEADGLVENYVYAIVEDRDGNLWSGAGKGASRYDGEEFTNFTKKEGFIDDRTGNRVSSILKGLDRNLWFTTKGDGVFRYYGKTFTKFTDRDGLAGNNVNTVFEDREGNIWFGHSSGNGLSRFNPRGLRNYGVEDGLTGTEVRSIAEDSAGNLWIATTDREGVCIYDSSTFTQPIAESRRVLGSVFQILADSKGNLWFATVERIMTRSEDVFNRERGVIRFDGTNYTRFTTLDGLVWNNVKSMIEDRNGNLWIGAGSGGWWGGAGVSRYDGKAFTNFTMADGLGYDDVTCLNEDHQGNIWIGAWGGGISRYDGTGFTNFTTDDGLVSNTVVCILTDRRDDIWIGTASGLCKYDGTSFTTLPQFAGRRITIIMEDRSGYLWFGTGNTGVIKTDGNALTHITTADGLPSNSIRKGGLCEDKDGNIWIGTREGLAKYTPNPIPPLIHIESVVADRVYEDLTNVSLPAETGYLRINYRGVSFRTRPEAMQYFYQLQEQPSKSPLTKGEYKGVVPFIKGDDDWQGPINERSVDYLDMKPGRYTFRVKSVDIDLNYSEPASVSFAIPPPPFYRTGIFLIGLSVMGGASLFVAIFVSVHRWRSSRDEKLRLQNELEDAHRMQLRLLPESAPIIEGFDIAGFSRPAREVGGDFFDYLSLSDGKIGIALADVSGKGLKGAMNAVMANSMLYDAAAVEASCGKVLSRLNARLYPRMERQMFTALALAIVNRDDEALKWANAAQPYPLVKRDGEVFEFKSDSQFPLGMVPDVEYPDWELELRPGDIVVFYTDGIIEAENGAEEIYSTERLEQFTTNMDSSASAEETIQAILQDVSDFVGNAEQYDDMTVVVVKKLPIEFPEKS